MANNRRRVKLFILNNESHQWDDHGTGHVSAMFTDQDNESNGIMLLVRSEEDGKVLLESLIQTNTTYQKQQDTLVVWSEADSDIALSFQMKEGCDEIWEKICQVVGKDPSVDTTQPVDAEEEEPYEELSDYSNQAPIELPKCELNRLDEICELCHSVLPSQIERDKLANTVESENYIPQLLELFHMCEDLENYEGLNRLYDIFKTMFMLEKNVLFEVMFAPDKILDVIGVLEYDPSKKEPTRHRQFLEKQVKYKEVLPIENKELLAKIHQTYRIQFIKDLLVPVPSLFDENLSTLSSFLFFSKIEIVTMIQEDDWFLSELFRKLTDDEISDDKRKDMVFFLRELCNLSQSCQQPNREAFFKILSDHGLLSTLEMLLNFDDMDMRSAIVDILCCIVEFTPSMVREYLSKEASTVDEDSILVNMLIDQLICNADTGMGLLLVHLLQTLLDPENMGLGVNNMEKSQFLSFFYRHCMHVLTAPLFAVTASDQLGGKDDFKSATIQDYIIKILSFCVDHHSYHIKNYILAKDLLRRVLTLMKSRHKFLALAALRFTRKIIGIKDEFYNRYIIKGKLLGPVVLAFNENGNKYNLLNSAILELFEFIRLEDVKTLCAYIIEEHIDDLSSVDYVETFRGLQVRYEQEKDRNAQSKERNSNGGIIHLNSGVPRKRRDDRSLDEDEETWFDSEEDDLSDASSAGSLDPSPTTSPSPPPTAVLPVPAPLDSPITKPLTAKLKNVDLLDQLPLRSDSPPVGCLAKSGTKKDQLSPTNSLNLHAKTSPGGVTNGKTLSIKISANTTSILNSTNSPTANHSSTNPELSSNSPTSGTIDSENMHSDDDTKKLLDSSTSAKLDSNTKNGTDSSSNGSTGDIPVNGGESHPAMVNGDAPLEEKESTALNGLGKNTRQTLVPVKKLSNSPAPVKKSPFVVGGLVPYDSDDDEDDDEDTVAQSPAKKQKLS